MKLSVSRIVGRLIGWLMILFIVFLRNTSMLS